MNRLATVFLSSVIAIAVIGYFVGIGDGVPKPDGVNESSLDRPRPSDSAVSGHEVGSGDSATPTSRARPWGQPKHGKRHRRACRNLSSTCTPRSNQVKRKRKHRANCVRRDVLQRCTADHSSPVENTNDAACYACHSGGVKIAGLKASVMSHAYLGELRPVPRADGTDTFSRRLMRRVETTFVGLPAPKEGKRAYKGAPPTIPHSRWMRENCNACHGGPHGWAGMESTHPWRTNCVQCHAPSATLDQMPESEVVPMLPPLDVVTAKVGAGTPQ